MPETVSVRIVGFLRSNGGKWFTRKQIGEGIGLKKTPYLANALDTLADGQMIRREIGQWGGFSCWYYCIDDTVNNQMPMFAADDFVDFEDRDNA